MSGERQVVVFTEDVAGAIAEQLSSLGAERVLVIAGPSRRFLERVEPALGGRAAEVFDEAEVHVPEAVVARALEVMRRVRADTVLTVGGGSATGLGKALVLEEEASLVAIPTTYSGSERTTIYGIKKGADKETGRAERVRPSVVIYDHTLTLGIPPKLTVQSLLNALAHPISAVAAGDADASLSKRALEAITLIMEAAPRLVASPKDAEARRTALVATSLAGEIIEEGTLGVHHRLAHFLGGRFGLPHAALHSLLLPQTVLDLSNELPAVYAAIADAAGHEALPSTLFDLLVEAGAETSLRALGVARDALSEAIEERPELPAATAWRAFEGERPR